MLNDDFLQERQNIREKMLKYSRAIKEGKQVNLDDDFNVKLEDDENLLKKRVSKKNKHSLDDFYHLYEEEKQSSGNIYLKKDLINVKLEEKKRANFAFFKKKDRKKKKENLKKAQEKPQTIKIPKKEPKKQENKALKEVKNTESENSAKTKNMLLDGYNQAMAEVKNLNFNNLLFSMLLIAFACIVFIPQIYIRNNIYYLSREIATLRSQEDVLSEENKELRYELEYMKFQNQILDYLE